MRRDPLRVAGSNGLDDVQRVRSTTSAMDAGLCVLRNVHFIFGASRCAVFRTGVLRTRNDSIHARFEQIVEDTVA